MKGYPFLIYLSFLIFFSNCKSKTVCKSETIGNPAFEVLTEACTGLTFSNKLKNSPEFNVFKYMYFYNGAGIGAADFNNDGLIDLFFSSNQAQNKLYLNSGGLKFKDVSEKAMIPQDGGWSTGVSVVDINNDGLLDIYVCRVGKHEVLNNQNQLLICKGIDKDRVPFYKDEAHEYGLDFSGFSTQAGFFDYDMDGDLDMFLLNHSIHQNGTFAPRMQLLATPNKFTGDRIFRNNGNNTFTDITSQTGINSSVLSYGLGVVIADINLDGYPDLYIGNDFHENDYLYINQQNGTFKEDLRSEIMHTSKYSMGVDVADINNDAYPEIISVDMLPYDSYILKRSFGEDAYDIFNLKISYEYNYQYTRNNLQYNRGNGMFSEVGLFSGLAATDWSWAPLWIDFDNDGLKDLFISNGIPKRLNDIDYIMYLSNEDIQQRIQENKTDGINEALIDKFPQIKIPNKFFKNFGELKFEDLQSQIQGDQSTYSNGAVYADFDNDGDLDIVVNNIDDPALLYRNTGNDKKEKPFLELRLKGPELNVNAIGAKVFVYANGEIRTYEKIPVKGFLSSIETPIHIGLDKSRIDSMFLVWPDNTYESIQAPKDTSWLSVTYRKNLPEFNYKTIKTHWKNPTKPVEDITESVNLKYLHLENPFVEFDREALIPHMISTEGPALAVSDVNHDNLDDVFIGSSKNRKNALFLQQSSGKFVRSPQPVLENDSIYEDVDACWTDVNNDGNPDLVAASGGNEYYGQDKYLLPRVYLNNGKAGFTKVENAFDSLYMTASCVVPYDFDGDGSIDLFIGGRAIPFEYGAVPRSYLLHNDGTGKFTDVTLRYAKDLRYAGFVTQAIWFDLDKDDDKDLIICKEWGGIDVYVNNKGSFNKKVITDKKGWWNFILPVDVNNDGNIDLVAGNLGLNSRLQASEKEPVRFYFADFDGNGKKEQIISYYIQGKEKPFATKAELEKQMPVLRKRFLYAEDFAKASLEDLFTSEALNSADVFSANYFANAIIISKGNFNFEVQEMPWEAQLSSYRDAAVINANNDSLPDILLGGNYYESNVAMGRYDADFGTILVNKGNGRFSCENINGSPIKGQVRHIRKINIKGRDAFVLARNNDSTVVIGFK